MGFSLINAMASHYDPVKQDRLRRNRESARKCRLKRKAAAMETEDRLNFLEEQNASLQRENERLHRLLAGHTGQSTTFLHPSNDAPVEKRAKRQHETGDTISLDSGESAVPATSSQQRIDILLAMVTTILCSTHAHPKTATTRPTSSAARSAARRRVSCRSLANRIIQCLREATCGALAETGRNRPVNHGRARRTPLYGRDHH